MAGKTTKKAAAKKKTAKKSAKIAKNAPAKRAAAKPTLLSGGNPQIAKADVNQRTKQTVPIFAETVESPR